MRGNSPQMWLPQWSRRTVIPFHSCSWCSIPEMATTEASVLRTHLPFSVGLPSTGASNSSRFVFSKAAWAFSFHSSFFPLLRISCCIGYTLPAYTFINSQIIGKSHELCVYTVGLRGSGLTQCLSTILPRYLFESLRISHFDGLHVNPALFMQWKTSSSLVVAMTTSST